MKPLLCAIAGVSLAASAQAQSPAETEGPAVPPASEDAAADAAAPVAEAAPPAGDAAVAAMDVSDAEIDSFAKATVKLQAIQSDAAIASDQKQTAMAAAVSEAGLDPAKYNAIGKAAATDATLRAKVQTAMSKYAPQPSEG